MNENQLEKVTSSKQWFWFIAIYLMSLTGFSIAVGLFHLLVPH